MDSAKFYKVPSRVATLQVGVNNRLRVVTAQTTISIRADYDRRAIETQCVIIAISKSGAAVDLLGHRGNQSARARQNSTVHGIMPHVQSYTCLYKIMRKF